MRKLAVVFFALTMFGAGCGDDTTPPTLDMGQASDMNVNAKSYNVTLTTAAETSVCATAGASATGTAKITVTATSITVDLNYSGLGSAASAAHIHFGAAGTSGPVMFTISSALSGMSGTVSKTFTATDLMAGTGGDMGAPVDFASAVSAIEGGQTYVNVHSMSCGAGEIRAQIQ